MQNADRNSERARKEHHAAWKRENMFKQAKSCCSLVAVLQDGKRRFLKLHNLLGAKFLSITILIEHVLQAFVAGGGSGGLIGVPIMLILSSFGISATRIQILETVSVSAWQLKPLVGVLSDALYIGGYNKMPYIILTSILGILSSGLLVALFPVSPILFTALVFPIFLQIATSDLLLESRYVQKTRNFPDVRPTLTSFINFVSGVCQLLSIVVVGVLIAYKVPLEWLYLSPIVPFFLVALLVYRNWIEENVYKSIRPLTSLFCSCCWFKEYDDETKTTFQQLPIFGLDTEKMKEHWSIFILALIIGMISLSTSVMGILGLSATSLFFVCTAAEVLMICAFYFFLDRRIANVLAFIVIQNACSISLRAATFFFYTDPVEAYPAGPHFTKQFYVSIMGGLAIILSLVGVFIYGMFLTNWTHRNIFTVTSFLFMLTCIPNIFLFKRWNIQMGIPDTVFVLGTEAMQVVVGQLNYMPLGVIMMALCSPGVESSLYAIMAGSSNLGNAFASYKGAAVLEWLDIKPSGNMSGESVQFDNLWIASTISLVIQVIPLVFIYILVPDAKQTDDLLEPKEEVLVNEQIEIIHAI